MPTHLRGPCIPGGVVTSSLPSPRVWHPSLLGLSFLEGRARPELPGSPKQNVLSGLLYSGPGLCKEGMQKVAWI